MANSYTVHAEWDDAANVWTTNGEDIPGLVCETASFDDLIAVVLDAAPDLLQANCGVTGPVEIEIVAARTACIVA